MFRNNNLDTVATDSVVCCVIKTENVAQVTHNFSNLKLF